MAQYKVPVKDINFCLFELFDYESHYKKLSGQEGVERELLDSVINELARYTDNVLAPTNKVGDEQGCSWDDGVVTTPDGFKDAYRQFVEDGWPSMAHPEAYGGQGLPISMGNVLTEMVGGANWAWCMYALLAHGALNTIEKYGTEQQKDIYLRKLVSGHWAGTMCLTEPHCGTDLGMLRTKAEPCADGSYRITGTKIFITGGEHDLTENIIHIVLARLPDAPAGTKGISLFIVPKFHVADDGSVAERNGVQCGAIEKKMGIKGSATCVMNFDDARGFLLGNLNEGLNAMFTFMNGARLGTAIQGLAHAEFGFQQSLEYARERLQMRSLSGVKNPDGPADPIIVHPDVRRMLLTQKAFSEGGRMLLYFLSQYLDLSHHGATAEERTLGDDMMSLLTPIAKAFMTETGFEAANHGLQCFGGHGYIHEWGVEQNVRDSRISTLYEGTTGIQALDLIGRKVLGTGGELLRKMTKIIHKFCEAHQDDSPMGEFVQPLLAVNKEWGELTGFIAEGGMKDPDLVGAASVDYMMYSGYAIYAYLWARAAEKSYEAIAAGSGDQNFYQAKIETARFFYKKLLPRTRSYVETIHTGAEPLMTLQEEFFAFS